MNWFRQHFTVAHFIVIVIAIFSPFVAIGTSAYVSSVERAVESASQETMEAAFNNHIGDGHPLAAIKMADENKAQIETLVLAVDKKLSKDVFAQFEKQLFQQLDRIERKP